jgi:hypothetical protein
MPPDQLLETTPCSLEIIPYQRRRDTCGDAHVGTLWLRDDEEVGWYWKRPEGYNQL